MPNDLLNAAARDPAPQTLLCGDLTDPDWTAALLRMLEMKRRGPDTRPVELPDAAALQRLRAMGIAAEGRPLDSVVDEMLTSVYPLRARNDHPRFFAFVPGPASPLSMLGDLMTSLHNIHAGSWLQSSGPSCIEGTLTDWLAAQLGLPAGAGGLFVSGDSMANLTALVVARERMLTEDERPLGVAYTSDQTHSSVAKGLGIIGFTARQIRKIRSDGQYRMDLGALAEAIAQDKAAGLRPFAVIASAGTTNTGSIDPLPGIHRLCAAERLWMHVDGAYGASIALSPAHRHLLDGIEHADSVSWDAHKWLFQTYGCGVVLLRDRQHLLQTYNTRPEYLRDAQVDEGQTNFWDMGPELTRPARALKLWLTLQVVGSRAMGEAIAHGCRLAQWAEDELAHHAHWQIVSPASLAIVNFRYAPPGQDDHALDGLSRAISQRALEEGHAAVLTTQLGGRAVLRICAIHPGATETDMRETVRRLDRHARELLAAR
ncbi:MAG: aminotransferase class V-fold PLP-dependent enzyme [Burkholderiales bacterium]|nr:aminotransferase class V-fold PLP-dependent enzyme [Burkholderiales bacterium]